MQQDIRGLLGIQGWVVYGVQEEAERIVVRVGKLRRGARCPQCGGLSRRVHQRMRWRRVWHLAVAGREVYLELRPRRCWCRPCRRTFTEAFEEIRKWSRRTRLGEALLVGELQGQSFGALARKTGLGYRALRGVVERAEVSPRWTEILGQARADGLALGIDEHSFRGPQLVTTVTEVWQHRLLGILGDDRRQTLRAYLEGFPSEVKAQVREVAIDMTEKVRKVVEQVLPRAQAMVDPFHVIQDANHRVDETRRPEQQLTNRELKKSPSCAGRRSSPRRSGSIWRGSSGSIPPSRPSGGRRSNCGRSIAPPTGRRGPRSWDGCSWPVRAVTMPSRAAGAGPCAAGAPICSTSLPTGPPMPIPRGSTPRLSCLSELPMACETSACT